jgi:hypothetical protein
MPSSLCALLLIIFVLGMTCVRNAFWSGVPFGGEGLGINGAAVPDMLHQYLLGVLKRAFESTKDLITSCAKVNGTASAGSRFRILDQRFKGFTPRHCDRWMAKKHFSAGNSSNSVLYIPTT